MGKMVGIDLGTTNSVVAPSTSQIYSLAMLAPKYQRNGMLDSTILSDSPNPARTSWSNEEVPGNLAPLWYRPIEPYISQNVQVIAANELVLLVVF